MSQPTPPQPPAGQQRVTMRTAMGTLLGIRRAIRAQRKAAAPEFVILNDRASHVAKQTEELARAGRLDEDAVAELRRFAGRRRHALTDALQHFKASDRHLEWRHYNRSVRLLEASIAHTAIAPEDPAVSERLDQLGRLATLDPAEAFEELATREPGLLTLRAQVSALPVRPPPQSVEEMREHSKVMLPILQQLRPLIGRERPDHDSILGSETASGICFAHLRRLMYPPGPPPVDSRPKG